MGRHLLLLLANPRLIVMAVLPFCVAFGLTVVERPVASWPAVIAPAVVMVMMLVIGLWRMPSLEVPRLVWRTAPRMALAMNTTAIVGLLLALTLVVAPWAPEYDNAGFLGVALGFSVAGSILCGLLPVAFMDIPAGTGFLAIGLGLFLGPFAGFFASIPLVLLWTEDLFRIAPSFMSREAWAILSTLVIAFMIALGDGISSIRAIARTPRRKPTSGYSQPTE